MIQRIQTIYLLVAGVLAGLTTFLPLAFFSTGSGELFDLYSSGLRVVGGETIQGTIYMSVLALTTTIIPFIAIFLFKNRMLQMRICAVEAVLLIGYYIMIGAYYFLSCRVFEAEGIVERGFHPALFGPIVSLVLSLLAAKAIFTDELLVRSVDRIR
ncbi:MAG: DUF4293 domain-containing protein [Rikenellaceae bacterium]